MNTNSSTAHYPVIVATPNDAKKYLEACHKIEESNKLKKKRTFEKIKKIFGKIVKKPHTEKIVVDDQYCFSIIDDESNYSNYFYTESSTDDAYSEINSNYYNKIIPPSPALAQSMPNQEVIQYGHNLNKKQSKLNFVRRIKEKKAAKKARKRRYREAQQQNNTFNTEISSSNYFASPKMKEYAAYDNTKINATASPLLNNKNTASSITSSVQESIPVPFSPSLVNTPYMNQYIKNGKTSIRYMNSRDDLSCLSNRKDYASSIYSDDSYHLEDDEENRLDDEEEIIPPSSTDATYHENEPNTEEEKKIKNPRYHGHFDDDSDDESSSKKTEVPMQRPLSTIRKVWDNPFGRISFIEYTIEKQKEKEKNEKNNNPSHYNIVTKPPLKNKTSKNGSQMIVSKRSVSSLSASLSKSRQEEVHNAAMKARENSSLALNKLATQNNTLNKKESHEINSITTEVPPPPQLKTKASESHLDDPDYNDKRGSVYSVTNLIKYSDFYNDSNDDSFSSTNADSHYSQALNQYNMYKNKKDNEDDANTTSDVVTLIKEGEEVADYDSNVLNFTIPNENGEQSGKDVKLNLKISTNSLDQKLVNRKAIVTEMNTKSSEETTEVNPSDETDEEKTKEEPMEFNRYLPTIPSANYLFNNPQLTRSRVLNIHDNSFNVLKHANTLKANRRSIIEMELKAKKEEEEKEKQREEARKEKEKEKQAKREAKKEAKRLAAEKLAAEKLEGSTEGADPELIISPVESEDIEEEDDDDEELESPKQPEDHYREYYEKEVTQPPEEESIDALLAKEKSKGRSFSEIVTKVFTRNNDHQEVKDQASTNDEKLITSPTVASPLSEAASVKSSTSANKSETAKTEEKENEEAKKEETTNNNPTISTRFFSFFKSPSKYLHNEEKEEEKTDDKEKEKEKEKDKDKEKEEEKEEKEKEDDKDSVQTTSPMGSPIRPYMQTINGSTKLVRSASLSLAKRHNRQIKESKNRNKKNLERNNSTCTNGSYVTGTTDTESVIDVPKKNNDEVASKTVTFADEEDDEYNEEADQTIILEKKDHGENDKTPTLSYKMEEEETTEGPILTNGGVLFTEPETDMNEFATDENIANKIHNLQNEIIVEEEEEQEEDILVKIQNEMKKKFQNDFDDHSTHEISDTFSIASCSTFSSAI